MSATVQEEKVAQACELVGTQDNKGMLESEKHEIVQEAVICDWTDAEERKVKLKCALLHH